MSVVVQATNVQALDSTVSTCQALMHVPARQATLRKGESVGLVSIFP